MWVAVTSGPRPRARQVGLSLVVVAIVAAVTVGLLVRSRTTPRGAPTVAAAYHYRPACLSVVVSTADPTYARADLERRRPCGRYGWSVTAIFHRVGGTWQRVLHASSYACPVRALPPAVQRSLSVCP